MATKTILLIDDDQVLVESLKVVLDQRFNVLTAGNGEEAMEQIIEHPPDLVILDIMLTYPSEGYDLASKLKKSPETGHIPIIMLTGVDQMFDLRSQAESSWVECDLFLTKPPDLPELLAKVDELLASKSK
jgi:CheY-like chemotaxis protein